MHVSHAFTDPRTGEPAKAVKGTGLDVIGANLLTLGRMVTSMVGDLDRAASIAGQRPATYHECLPSGDVAKSQGKPCHTAKLAADVAQALELLLPQAERLAKCCDLAVADVMAEQRGCLRADALPDAVVARATGKA